MLFARPLVALLMSAGVFHGCAMSPGLTGIRPVGDVAVGQTSVGAGNALVSRGQYGLAIAAYRRVLRLDPANGPALEGLAISYELLGRADLADRYYQEALALTPRNPRIYHNFAAFLRAQRRDADAVQLIADMRIVLPGVVTDEPVPTPTARAEAAPVAAAVEPDVRLIKQSERATLVVTVPRATAPVAKPAAEEPARMAVDGIRATRAVNAAGRHGVARQTAALLAKRGFAGIETGDAVFKLKHSRILVPARQRALGEQLSQSLPFAARIEENTRVDRVQILIGQDALAALTRARRT